MGNGDVGGHPYFHFHSGLSGREPEEVELEDVLTKSPSQMTSDELKTATATTESGIRLSTGLTLPEAFITVLEFKLAPKARNKRIESALSDLNWYYLMLDLTPVALKDRMIEKYGKRGWAKLLQTDSCKAAMRKAG